MNLLQVDSSILGDNSVSRTLSTAVVAHLKHASPSLTTKHRDLGAVPIAHLSGAYLAALGGAGTPHAPELAHDLADGSATLEEFLAADVIVIGVAFYNFAISSQLKSWIDRVVIAGQTFRYGEKGPEGLAGDKRVILAIARGGFYGAGTPTHAFEHAESYLRTVFGFLGVYNVEVVAAEGVAVSPEQRETSIKGAMTQIAALPVSA